MPSLPTRSCGRRMVEIVCIRCGDRDTVMASRWRKRACTVCAADAQLRRIGRIWGKYTPMLIDTGDPHVAITALPREANEPTDTATVTPPRVWWHFDA